MNITKYVVNQVLRINSWFEVDKWKIWILLSALLIFHILFLWHGHIWKRDTILYIDQAVSLAYGIIITGDSPFHTPGDTYPLGFPFILALVYKIGGSGIFPMQISIIFFLIGFLYILYRIIEPELGTNYSLLLVLIIGISPRILNFKGYILSDIPFMFFFFVAIYLIKLLNTQNRQYRLTISFLLGIVIAISALIRANGLILLPILLTIQIFSMNGFLSSSREMPTKYFQYFSFIFPYIAFSLFYVTVSSLNPGSANFYFKYWSSALTLSSVLLNMYWYSGAIAAYFPGPVFFQIIEYIFLIPFFFIGILFRKNTDGYLIITMGFYVLFYIFYPWGEYIRYILPVYPLFLYFAFQGMVHLPNTIFGKYSFCDLIIPLGTLLIVFSCFNSIQYANTYDIFNSSAKIDGPDLPLAQELFRHVKDNIHENQSIAFSYPGYLKLYTDRKTFVSAIRGSENIEKFHSKDIKNVIIDTKNSEIIEKMRRYADYSIDFENERFIAFRKTA